MKCQVKLHKRVHSLSKSFSGAGKQNISKSKVQTEYRPIEGALTQPMHPNISTLSLRMRRKQTRKDTTWFSTILLTLIKVKFCVWIFHCNNNLKRHCQNFEHFYFLTWDYLK